MAELIDRAALKAELGAACLLDLDAGIPTPGGKDYTVRMAIDAAPSVAAEPVVHARWIEYPDDDIVVGGWSECSKCGFESWGIPPAAKYCQDCGARMDADAPERGEGIGS